jgi:hypothetical protein
VFRWAGRRSWFLKIKNKKAEIKNKNQIDHLKVTFLIMWGNGRRTG